MLFYKTLTYKSILFIKKQLVYEKDSKAARQNVRMPVELPENIRVKNSTALASDVSSFENIFTEGF